MPNRSSAAGTPPASAPWLILPLLIIVIAGCIPSLPGISVRPTRLREEVVQPSERVWDWNKIAIIDIEGVIGMRRGGLLGTSGTAVSDVKQKLRMAARDARVKGVLLRIHSPGGEVVACDYIYNEIRDFTRETGKPVVAYVMNLGASGGYYVALSSDYIVAHPGAITGSVGVIMNFVNVELLTRMLGIESTPITSGEKKDMGSSVRQMTEEEREIFAEMNRLMFDRFIGLVAERRGISGENLETIADGRLLLASQAMELGMFDQVGMMDAAIEEIKRRAGIRSARIVAYTRFSQYDSNIYASFQAGNSHTDFLKALAQALAIETEPQMLYMWAPGR